VITPKNSTLTDYLSRLIIDLMADASDDNKKEIIEAQRQLSILNHDGIIKLTYSNLSEYAPVNLFSIGHDGEAPFYYISLPSRELFFNDSSSLFEYLAAAAKYRLNLDSFDHRYLADENFPAMQHLFFIAFCNDIALADYIDSIKA